MYGPKVLADATDVIVKGLLAKRTGGGIDTGRLGTPARRARPVSRRRRYCSTCRRTSSRGPFSGRCSSLRSDVEDKLNRLPLGYVDRQARGDLLSRVTNDIDNLAQSLQQTLSQLLTNVLTLVGVVR